MRKKSHSIRRKLTSAKNPSKSSKDKGQLLNTVCNKDFFIGRILLGTTFNCPPDKYVKCRISFLCIPEEIDRIHLLFDEISLIITLIIDTEVLKEITMVNIFSFHFSLSGEDLFADIHFRDLPLPKFNTRIGNCLKTIFSMTHSINLSEDKNLCTRNLCGMQETNELYRLLGESRIKFDDMNSEQVQHSSLKPILRPYQKDAVRWMMSREQHNETQESLHPLYTPLKLPSGLEIFFDKYSGHIIPTKPVVASSTNGGILAEEMGLGKTVEFLALILNHPLIDEEDKKHLSHMMTSSDSEIDDLEDLPVFKKQPKKISQHKMKKIEANSSSSTFVDKSKEIEVPEDWVKNYKNKSNTWIALDLWYKNALSEVNHKPSRHVSSVECVCGSTHNDDLIKCVDCEKFQHKQCVGFELRFGSFRCSSCWLQQPLVETRATLIVTPVSLRTQWCNEIKKHVNQKLRVLVYEGSNKNPVYPNYLREFDIVITTYSVLQSEFRLTEKGQSFELRKKRKYDYPGSPLSRIKWWRLCLDEAQTVETPGKIVSAMARKLSAQYRWAVTGTPISKDISDLFGLLDYLQFEPYNDFESWINLLYNPYLNGNVGPLSSYLSKIMWRSSKAEVIDQIDIPIQVSKEHALEFSAVEKFFYNKEHELSSQAFLSSLKNLDTNIPLAKLDKSSLKKIMLPLFALRQVCTHPNTVKGRYLATKRQVSTMKELLEALITKNYTESEEHLRLIVSSLNGMSGIYLLLQNPIEAAAQYRKVMQLSTRFSGKDSEHNLEVDTLQMIHTMHNLADLLDANDNVPPTLRDSSLRNDCRLLEQKYIEKFSNNTLTAYQEANNSQASTNELQSQFKLKEGQWYSDGLDWVIITNLSDELVNKIRNNHDNNQVKCPIELSCERTILYFIANWDEALTNHRVELISRVNRLFTYKENDRYKIIVNQELVQFGTDCHLRREKGATGKKKKCPLCTTNDFLKLYESKLFNMAKRGITFEEMSLQGSWKPTSQELILKSLCSLLRAKNATDTLVKDAEIHIAILENLRKEFKDIRKLWTQIYQQVAAQDELEMCKIKLRLEDPCADQRKKDSKEKALERLSYILENKLDTINMLNEHELDYHMMLLKSDETKGTFNLEKSLGVRSYLETLRKQQYEGQNPDPCPICRNVLEQHWSIFSCGHNYCMDCIHKLLEQTTGNTIVCCVCRQEQTISDVSYIRSGQVKNENIEIAIKGNFPTKIEAIIKFLLELKTEDENVKVLVFSSWITVLKFLKEALVLNDIKTEILLNSKLEERIENFKGPRAQEILSVLSSKFSCETLKNIE
ncbi:hypothetical protein WA026_007338 [Henosepilachna vigintioctopunctata]|uniref:E3 ubiquitin-protein ligase SHPRH n=1 Tax=Henosepilachna vigintioctopunctata TaxID=420089 RepID=A0AAW1UVK4_9CUCU